MYGMCTQSTRSTGFGVLGDACVCGIYVLSIRSTVVGVLGDALCVSASVHLENTVVY